MTSCINKTVIAIPIHQPYFKFGVNLVYSSMGAEYDLAFVFSSIMDKKEFEMLFPGPALKYFQSLVLEDCFNENQMKIIAEKRVHPTVKKLFALDCLKNNYLYVICMDAEIIFLEKKGWNEAAKKIIDRKCWFGGQLNPRMIGEQRIVQCSMTELPPYGSVPEDYFKNIENFYYTWWWDLPVYKAEHIDKFLQWVRWDEKNDFLSKITWYTFDHVVYQLFTCIFEGYQFQKIIGHCHSLEFSSTNVVEFMAEHIAQIHWVNGMAFAQNPGFYLEHEFLAVYNIDRTIHPQFK